MVFGQRLELTFYSVEFMQQCFPKLVYNYVLSQKVLFSYCFFSSLQFFFFSIRFFFFNVWYLLIE